MFQPREGVASFRNRNHEVYYRDKYNDNRQYRTTLRSGLTWDILPGLSLNPRVFYYTVQGIYNRFEAHNEVNRNRNASATHDLFREIQGDVLLNYARSFAGKHNTQTVLGSSYINGYTYNLNGTGYGAPTDNVRTLNATAEETQRTTSTESTNAMLSFFGRINYDYDRRYMLSVSVRRDGSSRFGEQQRWGTFPGVSAGAGSPSSYVRRYVKGMVTERFSTF